MKTNIIKNAQCEECGAKLHRKDIKPIVTHSHVDLIATCPDCGHTEVIDRIGREQVRTK